MSKVLTSPFTPAEAAGPNGSTPPAPPPEIRTATMTVTPDLAREWAGRNTRNRTVRYAKVEQFARDMRAGNWALNGETVKIDVNGDLIDGQHRIYACIKAEVPFQTIVIRGLPPEAQDTIDTGVARKMADQLTLRGEVNAALLAAVARWACKWLHGVRAARSVENEPTHAEMLALVDADPRIREATAWAANARKRFKSVNGSVYGMAWLLFHASDPLAADVFLEKVLTGADCPAGHPALAFRNRIWNSRENGERLNQYEQLAYMIMTWNAFKDDRPVKILKFTNGKLTAKNFPEPK